MLNEFSTEHRRRLEASAERERQIVPATQPERSELPAVRRRLERRRVWLEEQRKSLFVRYGGAWLSDSDRRLEAEPGSPLEGY